MSLINDALKKAQHERSLQKTPANLAGLTPVASGSDSRHTFFKYLFGAVIVVALMVCVTILLVTILGKPKSTPEFARTNDMEVRFAENEEAQKAAAQERLAQPVVASNSANAETAEESATEVAPPPFEINALKTLIPAEEPVTPQEEPPAPKPSNKAFFEEYIDGLVVSGVRLAGLDSKVIIDERVYRLLETINRDPKLIVTEITPQTIVFADEEGNTYVKSY